MWWNRLQTIAINRVPREAIISDSLKIVNISSRPHSQSSGAIRLRIVSFAYRLRPAVIYINPITMPPTIYRMYPSDGGSTRFDSTPGGGVPAGILAISSADKVDVIMDNAWARISLQQQLISKQNALIFPSRATSSLWTSAGYWSLQGGTCWGAGLPRSWTSCRSQHRWGCISLR